MRRTLLITNDFPPRPGGIQNYLRDLAQHLPAQQLWVYTSSWDEDAHYDDQLAYPVTRHRTSLLLPSPLLLRNVRKIIERNEIDTVWFGAAAPLGLLSPALRSAGVSRIIASTHGHEVGWSMIPGARAALRSIGESTDAITFVSKYARSRFASAFGPRSRMEYLPPSIDTSVFYPDPGARQELRRRHGLGEAPTLVCLSRLVPRKGQDMLLRALPRVALQHPDVRLVLVGGGPYRDQLIRLARQLDVENRVIFTGTVPTVELPAYHNLADLFVMPVRTRAQGLDVEGLGIVYLEAAACGIPVIAGNSGGASEAVIPGKTGFVVNGRNTQEIADTCSDMLSQRDTAKQLGQHGREWIERDWRISTMAQRLEGLLS